MPRPIPLSSPDISAEERRLVDEVLRSGQLSCGPAVAEFEQEFAARFGARHAVAVSSGTAALHVAMIAAGVREGDFVLTTPFSFIASANAILFEGATPLFVDIDEETLNIDPRAAAEAIERHAPGGRLRAILPVHVFGRPVEMHSILASARRHAIPVIEDACEAIGASVDGTYAGRWGDAAAFGFYPNKQMTTGEGGMLLTDRSDWAQLARSLRNQGRSDDRWLDHPRLGYNYRLDDLSAALGIGQLRRLDELLSNRASVAEAYNARLRQVDGLKPLAGPAPGMVISWFVYVVRLDPGIDRDSVMAALGERGIAAKPYFPTIHLQPLYREKFGFRPGAFPRAEAAASSLLALPFHGRLQEEDLERVCSTLAEVIRRAEVLQ